MRSLEVEERPRVIRSGRVEVKGVGISHFRFTRQWLCLTESQLLFFKDSIIALSKPSASIPYRDITSCSPDTLKSNCLRLQLGPKVTHITFKTALEFQQWSQDIESRLRPVLEIGGYISDNDAAYHFNSPCDDMTLYDSDSANTASASQLDRLPRRDSALTGSTFYTERLSTLSSSTVFDDEEWPELYDYKLEDKEFKIADIEENVYTERSCSPVDPDLVFEFNRVHLAVSDYPVAKECDIDIADLTGKVCKLDDHAAAIGGFADIWRGHLNVNDCRETIAIKVIRSFCFDEKTEVKVRKRLERELDIWKRLRHDYIVPLYGVVYDMGRYPSMISPWMERGCASKFFENQNIQRTFPARLKLLYEVASGLEYLHCFSPPVIHGDLKASNILISDLGHALLTDFGISTIIEEATGSDHSASSFAGSVRWMAFELFNDYREVRESGDGCIQLTTCTDIWSFGSTALEVLSGKLPYYYRRNDVQVLHEILLGFKPLREEFRESYPSITPDIWTFLHTCWSDNPQARPSISSVKKTIGQIFKEKQRMGIVFQEGFMSD